MKSIITHAVKVGFLIVIARVCVVCMGLELITIKVVVCVFPKQVL